MPPFYSPCGTGSSRRSERPLFPQGAEAPIPEADRGARSPLFAGNPHYRLPLLETLKKRRQTPPARPPANRNGRGCGAGHALAPCCWVARSLPRARPLVTRPRPSRSLSAGRRRRACAGQAAGILGMMLPGTYFFWCGRFCCGFFCLFVLLLVFAKHSSEQRPQNHT